jgi:transketolase
MSNLNKPELEALALKVRERIVKMSTDGGCFLGASLSCTDLIVHLYKNYLNVTKENLKSPDRDYCLLSKGHDVPALYGAFAELGFIEADRLKNHLKTTDSIYWHPNRDVPGVEFHSGSLGHLFSVSMGIAKDIKMRGGRNRVLVILGDGECNEGTVWEACLVASAYKLDNLLVVIDRNEFQANMRTEELIPLESLKQKFEAFGFQAIEVDGHSFEALDAAKSSFAPALGGQGANGRPTVMIAKTVRGKGLPSIEARADRWFCNFTHDEVNSLLQELHGKTGTQLQSETLVVR